MVLNLKGLFKNKRILVLGGLGFIGSNFIDNALLLGSNVTVIDKRNFDKSLFRIPKNIEKIDYIQKEISDFNEIEKIIEEQDFIMDFVGYMPKSKNESPLINLGLNCIFHLKLLEACKKIKFQGVIVNMGSRLQYGTKTHFMVSERSSQNPLTLYGIHKLTTENYFRYYNKKHGLKTISFRLSNPYGPENNFHQTRNVINYLIYKAYTGEEITLYAKGERYKDIIYVDDVINAILVCLSTPKCYGEVFNLGSGDPLKLREIVESMNDVMGKKSNVLCVNLKTSDESYVANIKKIIKFTGWKPKVCLRKGLLKTKEYLDSI